MHWRNEEAKTEVMLRYWFKESVDFKGTENKIRATKQIWISLEVTAKNTDKGNFYEGIIDY